MAKIFTKFLLLATTIGIALAKSADTIVCELGTIEYLFNCLDSRVEHFRNDKRCAVGQCHNFIELNHIYKLNTQLERSLVNAIESVQCSCDFTCRDTKKIYDAVLGVNRPVRSSLRRFRCRKPSFECAFGPYLTCKVIGHALKRNRCLVLDLLRSVECKADCKYKKPLSAMMLEFDNRFHNTIAMY